MQETRWQWTDGTTVSHGGVRATAQCCSLKASFICLITHHMTSHSTITPRQTLVQWVAIVCRSSAGFLVSNSRDEFSSLYYLYFYWIQNYWQEFWDGIARAFSIFALDIIWTITDNVKATRNPHRDEGMEIRAQMVRISTDTETSGKVPKLQFSHP